MKISCPHCHNIYALPENAVPAGGREVQCAKCQTVWRVSKDEPLLLVPDDAGDAPVVGARVIDAAVVEVSQESSAPIAQDIDDIDDLDERIGRLEELLNARGVASNVSEAPSEAVREARNERTEAVIVPFVSRRVDVDVEENRAAIYEADYAQKKAAEEAAREEAGKSDAPAKILSDEEQEAYISDAVNRLSQNVHKPAEPVVEEASVEALHVEAVKAGYAPENVVEPAILAGKKQEVSSETYSGTVSHMPRYVPPPVHHPSPPSWPKAPADEAHKMPKKRSSKSEGNAVPAQKPAPRRPQRPASAVETKPAAKKAVADQKSEVSDAVKKDSETTTSKAETAARSEVKTMPRVNKDVPPVLLSPRDKVKGNSKALTPKAKQSAAEKKENNNQAQDDKRAREHGSFWTVFTFIVVALVLLFALRYLADPIARAVPALAGIMAAYSQVFDGVYFALANVLSAFIDWVRDLF